MLRSVFPGASRILALSLFLCSINSVWAEEPKPLQGRFLVDQTVVRVGLPQAIPVALPQRPTSEAHLEANVTSGTLQLLGNPTLLPGAQYGFVRVLASEPGESLLQSGEALIRVRAIESNREHSPCDLLRIITPIPGAAVWRSFRLGVEAFDPQFGSKLAGAEVRLRFPDGSFISPVHETGPDSGPTRHLQFEIDPSGIPVGPADFVAVARCRDGSFLESEPLRLQVVSAQDAVRIQGECEDHLLVATTEGGIGKFGNVAPKVQPAKPPEGEAFIKNNSSRPAWHLPVKISEEGTYQLALRVRSNFAGGGYPSIGLHLNEADKPLTTSRVASPEWHWIPVGKPIFLKTGEQVLTPFYSNDFNSGKYDRGLALDKYDLLKVPSGEGSAASADAATSQMMMTMAPTMSSGEATPAATAKVGVLPPLNDALITTRTSFRALSRGDKTPPTVLLQINGKTVQEKKANDPPFEVDPEMLKEGANYLQVISEDAQGVRSSSELVRVFGPKNFSEAEGLPVVKLLYPSDEQTLYEGDVVIASVMDNRKIKFAEILIEGKPSGFRSSVIDPAGRVLIPLPLRGIPSSKFSVRVVDDAGNESISEERRFQVAVAPPNSKTPYARAVRLTQRFAYGPEPAQLATILLDGERAWFEKQLDSDTNGDFEAAARLAARLKHPRIGSPDEVSQRAIYELLLTAAPIRARFVLWSENHFSTWIRKVGAPPKWKEHATFDSVGVAPFLTLLRVSAHSPAMLFYLDQQRSLADRLNENYARELMELHTLGVHGGYTQADVTSLAKLLNGWMLSDEADPEGRSIELQRFYRFDPQLADVKPKVVLGLDFPVLNPSQRYDQVCSALEILAAHPSTGRFISEKLAAHYLGFPAPEKALAVLSEVYARSGGDMAEMLRTLANREELWNDALEPKIATPLDYAVRLCRLTGSSNAPRVMDCIRKSGTGLFERSTPDGYQEENEAYMNSNALLQRWRLSQAAADQLQTVVPVGVVAQSPEEIQGLVDFLAMRLNGLLLGPRSNEAALQIAEQLKSPAGVDSVQLAAFIAQLPESNLR